MTDHPMDILSRFPVRRWKNQKQAFLAAVQSYADSFDYRTKAEHGHCGCENLVIGDPETALYLITADYHRNCSTAVLLETVASMPVNLRKRVCFVLFDGKAGVTMYRKKHRLALELQMVLFVGWAGKGDTIIFRPDKAVCADADRLDRLIDLERRCGTRRIQILDKKTCRLPFPAGVHVYTKASGLFDSAPDHTNVNILRACLITFISGGAAQ